MNRHIPSLGAIVGLVVVAASWGPAPALAAYPGEEGRIAFVRDGEIWTAKAGGTDKMRLTRVGIAGDPVWSPDGQRIAFSWTRPKLGSAPDIWTMYFDGSDKRRVTIHRAADVDPTWSPNGRWLAFASWRGPSTDGVAAHIFKTRASATSLQARRLTDGGDDPLPPFADLETAWSPTGDVIAFRRSFSDGGCSSCRFSEIWTVTPDGEAETALHGVAYEPSWSPDAERIAYVSDTWDAYDQSDSYNVFHVASDGTDSHEVTDYAAGSYIFARHPAWSPEGHSILFDLSDNFAEPDIWRISTSGEGDPVRVVRNAADADWQPLSMQSQGAIDGRQ